MNPLAGDPRVAALSQATADLTKPGQPFETTTADVRGERMTVFANRPRSLRDVLVVGAARGEADCYVFGDGRRISFAGMQRQAASVAAALQTRYGIGPGDRVAICAANCPEWIQLFWAVASLNAVLVAMNGWWTGVEMANGLALTEPKLIVMDEKRRARLETDPGAPLIIIERDFASLLDDEDAALPTAPIAEDDPFMLIFTSGTTGRPKAAVLSHRCVIGYLQLQAFLGARGLAMAGRSPGNPPVRLAPFPLFHVSGLSATVSTMMGAGVTVWPLGRFDPDAVIELTRREQVTVWGGATTHVMRLMDSPAIETIDPAQIVQVSVGGSATTPALMRRTAERFPHLDNTMSTGYGSTETGGLATWAPNWMLQAAIECVGPAVPTAEVRITDETGAPVADGVEGNVEVRCPIVMLGYWRNEAANDETLLPGLWVRTGDFGRWEGGLLFLASRKRDLIIRGGENVYPFEIENRLDEHPDVLEAAVIGVEDTTLGQDVKAVVVVREGRRVDADELRAFCAQTLASYKVPALVDIRTEPLPRNATGKIMKHALDEAAPTIFVEE